LAAQQRVQREALIARAIASSSRIGRDDGRAGRGATRPRDRVDGLVHMQRGKQSQMAWRGSSPAILTIAQRELQDHLVTCLDSCLGLHGCDSAEYAACRHSIRDKGV